jgi:hypothetical protein
VINPQAYIVGEVWGEARQWLQGDQFDGVMNYLFAEAAIAFSAGHRVRRETVAGRSSDPWPGRFSRAALHHGQLTHHRDLLRLAAAGTPRTQRRGLRYLPRLTRPLRSGDKLGATR